MGLSAARNTPQLGNPTSVLLDTLDAPLKAGAKVFVGGLIASDSSGYYVDPTATTGLIVAGRVEPQQNYPQSYDNTAGSNGTITAKVRQGVFRFDNGTSGDLIAVANRWALCYLIDDHTVGLTDGEATPRSVAGIIVDVDSSGVYVFVCAQVTAAMVAALATTGASQSVEQIAASGALSLTIENTILAVSATKAYTLAAGTRVGQKKRVSCKSAASTPNGVLTVTSLSDSHTTVTFSAAGQFVLLVWDGSNWNPVELSGAVIA